VTYVKKIEEISAEKKYMRVEKMTDEGYEIIEMSLPALITVVKEINEPRLESLRGKMRARSAQIPVWTAADICADPNRTGLAGSPTQVIKIFTPPGRGKGEIFEGDAETAVDKLVARLREKKIV